MEESRPDLARRLARELHAEKAYQRLTWPELAQKAGLSERALQRYLNVDARDWRPIRTDDLETVCKALGVPPDEMFMRAVTGNVTRSGADETAQRRRLG